MMKTQLIIAEKPNAAFKIAQALGTPKEIKTKKAKYYEIDQKSKKIFVAPAVGHLYTLKESQKGWKYPSFDIEWKPTYETVKTAAFAKPYFDNLSKLAKKSDDFIIATDYDVEGEVIGLNILRFICGQKDAKRMKFSTLTKDDLKKSYENLNKTLNWGQAEAGLTRHYLDWYWGINLSKAITDATYLTTNYFQVLSIGRVQGPTLKLIYDKELEISKFKPKDFWQIFSTIKFKDENLKAKHKSEKFWKKSDVDKILDKIKNKKVIVEQIRTTKQKVKPPVPFDLTTLQIEAFRVFKFSPKQTLQIAQQLYDRGLISYPRTSSQKIPASINYRKILSDLCKNKLYKGLASDLAAKKSLSPNEGKKTDPAHPSIYPTGDMIKSLDERQAKLYDLIVKRFLSVFGDEGLRESKKISLDINGEPFVLSGIRTITPGWMNLYAPYSEREETELPDLKKDQKLSQDPETKKDATKAPPRYSEASLIKQLEKEKLGTKATRAQIIDTLYERNYIASKPIQLTKLGFELVSTFNKYAEDILSEDLTRKFELEMEKVRSGKQKREKVLENAKKVIVKILTQFDKRKTDIGKNLSQAMLETKKEEAFLMICPKCHKADLRLITSKKTGKRFFACANYPKCKLTWPAPQKGKLIITKTPCKNCQAPLLSIYKFGRKPWILCPNPDCPGKKEKNQNK